MKDIAYCGLYCPKCYKMVVSASARQLKDDLNKTHIGSSEHNPGEEFMQELQELVNLHCFKFCRNNSNACPIKDCCKVNDFEGCWDCAESEECNLLKPQFRNNIRIIQEHGFEYFIENYD